MYPLSNQRRCMIRNVPTTTSRAVKRLKDLSVPKTHIAAIRPQRPGRRVPVLHRPACLTSATVPEVKPLTREDHDPGSETQLRSRRGWADTGGHSLTGVRTHLRTFFLGGEKYEKPLYQAHLQNHEHQVLMKMMQKNSVLGENLEDLHGEYQRSAQHLLNSVLGENLEDLRVAHHPAELECPRSAP